jgi:Xaa-Pro aminopeptidase
MVLNIETPYYELGFGGLQIEHTIVVTEGGHRYLTTPTEKLVTI